MIDNRTKLHIYHDDNSTFADHSENAVDFSRDTFSMTLSHTEDYLYMGYFKPIGAVFIELSTPNTTSNTLTFEYYNGSAWTSLEVRDETKGFTRSGFITWTRPTDQTVVTINNTSDFFIRCRPSATHTATTVRGINLVFADDTSLSQEFPGITDEAFYQTGETSHILQHVAARNQIVQQLRSLGYSKYNNTTGEEMINQWELLDLYEVRQAAVYKALANIFFNLSDSPDDNWFAKHEEYKSRFDATIRGVFITIDSDDDGVKDAHEKLNKISVTRFTY